MLARTLTASVLALSGVCPAWSQGHSDIDELRLEVQRLREELRELQGAQPRAVVPAPAPTPPPRANLPDGDAGRAPPRVSAIAGGLLVPGTTTSVRLYGAIEGHAIHDLHASGPSDNFTDLSFQPLDSSGARTGRSRFTAETSRLGFESSTPLLGGELKTKLEMDFYSYGSEHRNRLRLRHAYAEHGGWLIGQTWSTFMDIDNSPETVDFNGPIGAPFSRRMMVRYAVANAQAGSRFTVALEDPQDQAQLGAIGSADERWPQLVLRYDQGFAWGGLNLRGLTHQKRSVTTTRRGYGVAVGGYYKFSGNDVLMAQYTRVDGDADQLYGSNGYEIAVDGTIAFDRNQGLVIGYAKAFSPRLRGTTAIGLNRAKTAAAVDNRRLQELFINLIYSPLPGVELGAEVIRGRRVTFSGDRGTLSRIDLMARHGF